MLRLTRQANAADIPDLEPYEAEVTRTIESGFRWMYFPRQLEDLFESDTQLERSRHLVAVGILWILLGLLAAIVLQARAEGPAPFGMHPLIRLGVVTPFLVAVVVAVWWGVRPAVRELLIMGACILAPATMILGVMLTPGSDLGTNRGALTIILLFITVVVRVRFWYAAAAVSALVALQVGLPLALGMEMPGSAVLSLITILATLTANYSLEREYRLNYLERLRGRIQGKQLQAMVRQLHELSHRDALTGLANRRALDELLADLCAKKERFAVILVDIDSFKAFNDCYGHQVGDDALRRVAAMMRASLRFTTDRIARMGGEEFAVVLPRTALEDARTMAERMRKSVFDLLIPHVKAPHFSVVTISAGVAASNGGRASADVIAEADKALYLAKTSGRNRVEISTMITQEMPIVVRDIPVPA